MFDKKWFIKNQRLLKWFANTSYGKDILGYNLDKVDFILPNAVFKKEGKQIKAEFRTHNKYSKRLFYEFKPIWKAFHWFDMNVANIYVPKLNLGFDTLTAYPDAHVETNTVDGMVYRNLVDEAFNTIMTSAGSGADDTTASTACPRLQSGTTASQYISHRRTIFLFNTAALTSGATISAATLSVSSTASTTGLGSPDYDVAASNPASNTALVGNDYQTTGTTSFGSIAAASWSTAGYNDIPFNAAGLASISKTSISKYSGLLNWDVDRSFGGSWASSTTSGFTCYFADQAGTTDDPKLVITYSLGYNAFIENDGIIR